MAENILIDFVINDESLAPAIDQLEKLGLIDSKIAISFKQTNAEINKQASAVKNVASASVPLKKNLDDVSKSAKNTANQFMIGFQEGIVDTLNEAGVSLDEFEAAMAGTGSKVAGSTQTVRAELRELVETMARAKAEGRDFGEEYDIIVQKAGRLKDAIGDVNTEIGNAGSDTRGLDNIVGTATAAAGAFSAVQGAAALFGDESEELQEVLLRVNAAMAIAQGLQVVSTALQKEGAITLLATNIQRKIQNAQIVIENALQSRNVIVKGLATIAQKALNAAMLANPVGLLVVGIATLVLIIKTFTSTAENATAALHKLNLEFERDVASLDTFAETVRRNGAEIIAGLEAQGAKSSQINKQTIENLKEELRARLDTEAQYKKSHQDSFNLLTDVANGRRKLNKEEVEEAEQVVATFNSLQEKRAEVASQIRIKIIENEKQIRDEQKEAAEKAKADSEKAETDRREARDQSLQDIIAGIERQLLAVEQGSNAELVLQKKLIVAKANLELNAEKLTQNEIGLIRDQSLKDREVLQKAHDDKVRASSIDAEISKNNAIISLLKTNDDERLLLQLSNIGFAAQKEIDAAEGNGAKIKEIIAKRDQDIRDTKIKFIQEAVEFEIALETARGGSTSRALERIASDEKAKKDLRIRAINELADIELSGIDKRIDALQSEKDQRLISDKDFQLKYEQLQDQKVKVSEDTEKKITGIIISEEEKRKRRQQDVISLINDSAQLTVSLIDNLASLQADKDNLRIEAQRNQLEEQREAGQITEKEFLQRQKRMEAEEKRVRYEQARRDKQLALFKAVVNTALAVTNAITTGDPYTAALRAAIVAAIGLAEIAVINSRPIPRFGKGKKKGDSYTGLGEVGETGAELLERDGHLYLAPKKTIVHIKSQDIIHNPTETKSIFQRFTKSNEVSKKSEHLKQLLEKFSHTDKSSEKSEILKQLIQKEIHTNQYSKQVLENFLQSINVSQSTDHVTRLIEKSLNTVNNNSASTNTREFLEKALHLNSTVFFQKAIESKSFFENVTHKVDKQIMSIKELAKPNAPTAQEIGKEVGKYIKNTEININKDFIKESIADGLAIINHHSKYYRSP